MIEFLDNDWNHQIISIKMIHRQIKMCEWSELVLYRRTNHMTFFQYYSSRMIIIFAIVLSLIHDSRTLSIMSSHTSWQFDKKLQAVELTIVLEQDRLSLMQEMHDQFASDHSNVNKIIRLLRRNYRWSEMIRDVKQFIKNCHTCRRAKVVKNKYNELLNLLSISNWSWIDIILAFVIELFESRNYNAVFMIINRLSKMHHYISCTTNENETTIEETAKLLIQHVWKLHELLITMIFDRDFQFISLVWNIICKILKIKTKLFTAFHSKTNEQSEIFNQKMKRYLRAYVNNQQNDWADWLFMTKYAFNAFISIIIRMSSFLVNYEFESRISFDHVQFEKNTIKKRINKFRKRKIVFIMKNIWKFAKKYMKKSQ
jgi:hypothetical protein